MPHNDMFSPQVREKMLPSLMHSLHFQRVYMNCQLSRTGQFFHMAPQPGLDASVVIVSLEETWPRGTPCWRPSIENHHLMDGTHSGSTDKIIWLSLCGLTTDVTTACEVNLVAQPERLLPSDWGVFGHTSLISEIFPSNRISAPSASESSGG